MALPQHLAHGHGGSSSNYSRTSTPVGHSHGQISPFDIQQRYLHPSVSSNGVNVNVGAGVGVGIGERTSSLQHLDHGGGGQGQMQLQGHMHSGVGVGHARGFQNQQQQQVQGQSSSSSFDPLPQVPGHDLYDQQQQQQHRPNSRQGQNISRYQQQQQQQQQQEYHNLPQHMSSHSQTHNHASRQGHRQQQVQQQHQSQPGGGMFNIPLSLSSSRSSSQEHMNSRESTNSLQLAASMGVGVPEFQQQHQQHQGGHISPLMQQQQQQHQQLQRHPSRSPDDFSPIARSNNRSQQSLQRNISHEQQQQHSHQRGHHSSIHSNHHHQQQQQNEKQQQQSHHRGGKMVDQRHQQQHQQQQQQQQISLPNYQQQKRRSPVEEQKSSISPLNYEALQGTSVDNSNRRQNTPVPSSTTVAGSASVSAKNTSVASASIGDQKKGGNSSSGGGSGSKPLVTTSTRGRGNGAIRGNGHGGSRNAAAGGATQQHPKQVPSQPSAPDVELQKRQQEYIRTQMALPQNAKLIQADQNIVHNQTEAWWVTFQSDLDSGMEVVTRNGSPECRIKYYQDALQIIQNYRRASQGEKIKKLRLANKLDPMTMFGLIKREIHLIKVACNSVSGVLRKYYYKIKNEFEGGVILNDEKKISIKMAKWAQDIEIKLQAVIFKSRSILQERGALPPSDSTMQNVSKGDNDGLVKGDSNKKKSSSSKKKKRPENKESTRESANNEQKDDRKGSSVKRKKAGGTNRKSKDTKSKKVEKESYTREIITTAHEAPSSPNVVNLKKHPNGPIITIKDQFPDRITNPLLELPHGSMSGDPTMTVSEYLRYIEVYFPEPDTYPVSYYAKILGIDIPKNLPIAPNQLATKDMSKDDNWHSIPEIGKYGSLEQIRNVALDSIDLKNTHRDQDFVDPVWRSILKDYRGYRDDVFRPATEFHKPCELSTACLEFAREVNIVDNRMSFRVATLDDVTIINEFNKVRESLFFQEFSLMTNAC